MFSWLDYYCYYYGAMHDLGIVSGNMEIGHEDTISRKEGERERKREDTASGDTTQSDEKILPSPPLSLIHLPLPLLPPTSQSAAIAMQLIQQREREQALLTTRHSSTNNTSKTPGGCMDRIQKW